MLSLRLEKKKKRQHLLFEEIALSIVISLLVGVFVLKDVSLKCTI